MRGLALGIIMLLLLGSVSAECFDTDDGKDKYEAGAVTDNSQTYEDECQDEDIKEYFCNTENIAAYTLLPCVNGCDDGQCTVLNQATTYQSPEDEDSPYTLYFYGISILLVLGLYIYWFKSRKRRRR